MTSIALFLEAGGRKLAQHQLLRRQLQGRFRQLSSVSAVYHDDAEDDDVSDATFSQKQEALKKALGNTAGVKTSFRQPSASLTDPSIIDSQSLKKKNDSRSSPAELTYTGNATMPITTKLHIVTPEEDTPSGVWPVFRLMVSQCTIEWLFLVVDRKH